MCLKGASKANRLRRIEFKLSCFVITYLWKGKSAFENNQEEQCGVCFLPAANYIQKHYIHVHHYNTNILHKVVKEHNIKNLFV